VTITETVNGETSGEAFNPPASGQDGFSVSKNGCCGCKEISPVGTLPANGTITYTCATTCPDGRQGCGAGYPEILPADMYLEVSIESSVGEDGQCTYKIGVYCGILGIDCSTSVSGLTWDDLISSHTITKTSGYITAVITVEFDA
jgi:hypothetical protein